VGTAGSTGHLNELGIFDMSGNAWEWCWDWYADSYPNGLLESDAIVGRGATSGPYRVYRGGSYDNVAATCAIAYRTLNDPINQFWNLGIRVVRN